MRHDLFKYAVVISLGSLIGLLFGFKFEGALIGAIAVIVWQSYSLNQLYQWLINPKKHPIADTSGQVQLLHRELNRVIESNTQRKKQISNYVAQFRRAVSVLPDAIILIDNENRIQWANQNAFSVLGIKWPNDRNVGFKDLVRDPSIDEIFDRADDKSQNDLTIQQQGLEFASPTNNDLTLNIKLVPYTEGLWMVIARDVSRLLKVNRMHSEFVANVSHELKTPLTVLRGYLEILHTKFSDRHYHALTKEFSKPLEQMKSQSDRMQLIVNDLLYLSKLEDHLVALKHESFDFHQIIDDVMESLSEKISVKKTQVTLDIEHNLKIIGDRSELYSAVSNLITNAINYTSESGKINIFWKTTEDGAHFKVEDDGAGIAESHIPRLTQRFYRVDDDRSREGGGTGLGLAIVKHVLRRHQSELEIKSSIGKGSSFGFVLGHERVHKGNMLN